MEIGSSHNWRYNTKSYYEDKTGKFKQTQSKRRNKSAPRGSGMPRKSKLIWGIRGNFRVSKKNNKYVRVTKGIKKQKAFRTPKRQWIKSKRQRDMDNWKEKKIAPRKWKIRYEEHLRKKPKMMKGKVKAKQFAIKRNKDKYDLIMKGKRYKKKKGL